MPDGENNDTPLKNVRPFKAFLSVGQKAVSDFISSLTSAAPILILIVGGLLMTVGEAVLFFTEDGPQRFNVVIEARPNTETPAKGTIVPIEAEDFLSPGARSLLRFLAELVGVKVGELLVVSWFLHTFLHTTEYKNFFLDQVERAMMAERVMNAWSKSLVLWQRTAQVYFGSQFPLIKHDLTDTLFEYFPLDHSSYLFDYKIRMRIWMADGLFHCEEDIEFDCVPKEGVGMPKPFRFRNEVTRDGPDDKITFGKVEGVWVDQKATKSMPAYQSEVLNNDHILAFDLSLEVSKSSYHARFRTQKGWFLRVDPYKQFVTGKLVHKLTVTVEIADGLVVEWQDVGVLKNFVDLAKPTPTRLEKHYPGLIFRKQGFRMFIREKEKA